MELLDTLSPDVFPEREGLRRGGRKGHYCISMVPRWQKGPISTYRLLDSSLLSSGQPRANPTLPILSLRTRLDTPGLDDQAGPKEL